jgi:hypothetical protein
MRPKFAPLFTLCGILALFSCTGCAGLSFSYSTIVAPGVPPQPNPAPEDEVVKVLFEKLPDGVTIKDGQLVADATRYELLGRISVSYNRPTIANFGFWPYKFKKGDRWRYALCPLQVPLAWVTLSLWAWISPTYWPCHVSEGTEPERREAMIDSMTDATKLIGGNMLIIAGFQNYDFVRAKTDPMAPQRDGTYSFYGAGYALREKRR